MNIRILTLLSRSLVLCLVLSVIWLARLTDHSALNPALGTAVAKNGHKLAVAASAPNAQPMVVVSR